MTNLAKRSLNLLRHVVSLTTPTTILLVFGVLVFAIAVVQAHEITFKFEDIFELILKK